MLIICGILPASPPDRKSVLGKNALAKTDALSEATMDLFVSAYGAEAGNLALKAIARGGVYVAGGIAPKILPALTDGRFLKGQNPPRR